ncbi:MAG: PAS domain S-box protein [bacterium]|nr:PAS domain S-box protein [bacterium]
MHSKGINLVEGKYPFADLVNTDHMQVMFRRFSAVTGFSIGLVSLPDFDLLISTGMQDICVNFHRACPASAKLCRLSSEKMLSDLQEQTVLEACHCENGLVFGASPIIIKGVHVANLVAGQILLVEPDPQRFKRQSEKYGYDTEAYLTALDKVPIKTEAEFREMMGFLDEWAAMFTEQAQAELEKRVALQTAMESEENLRTILNSIGDAVICTDTRGHVTSVNPMAEKLTGWSAADAQGEPLTDVFHIINDRTREIVVNPVANVLATGEIFGLANHTILIARDGRELQIADSAAPIKHPDGTISGVVLVFRDVTEEYRVKEELEQLGAMVEQTVEGVAIANTEGVLKYVNRAWIGMHGYDSADELVGRHLNIFHTPAEMERVVLPFINDVLRNEHRSGEVEHRRKDGSTFPGQMTVSMLKDDQSVPNVFIGFCRDITDRKRAELALLESKQHLNQAQAMAKVGHWALDVAADTISGSDELHRIFGVRPNESARAMFDRVFHPDDRDRYLGNVKRGVALGEGWNVVDRLIMEDCSTVYVHSIGEAIKDDDGNVVRLIVTVQDISERVSAEEDLEKLQKQFVQAQKMESVGRLAGGVAHDFNNMLMVILGHTELLQGKVGVENPFHLQLDEIRKAAERSADLTRQLLAFARKQTVAPQVLNLNDIVGGMLKMLRRLLGEDIDLAWLPSDSLWSIRVDPGQVDQILANLCVNARDAIHDVGKIIIETRNVILDEAYCADHIGFMPGEFVELAVTDDGIGMPREILQNIWEPFFTTKGVGEGTGLGLATIYGIVKQNEGFVNAYSELGEGTTFRIFLPRYIATFKQERLDDSNNQVHRGHETVLLVEDEDIILNLGKGMLEELGYRVLAANSPQTALEIAGEYDGEIHLLLTDVVMPEMNGRELASRMMRHYPKLKLLFMSGYPSNVIAHRGVLDEGVLFMQKPFSLQALSTNVRDALASTERGSVNE